MQKTMTFLQYVLESILGPPHKDYGNGKSKWTCPVCGVRDLSTRPHKDDLRDSFSCFNCGIWGWEWQAIDLLDEQRVWGGYGADTELVAVKTKKEKGAILKQMRKDYARLMSSATPCISEEELITALAKKRRTKPESSGGVARATKKLPPKPKKDPPKSPPKPQPAKPPKTPSRISPNGDVQNGVMHARM
jgi:hypothetical protein